MSGIYFCDNPECGKVIDGEPNKEIECEGIRRGGIEVNAIHLCKECSKDEKTTKNSIEKISNNI